MTWFASSAIPAAASADAEARFQRVGPYGRARNQSPTVAAA